MKVIQLIGGGDIGGAKTHVLSLAKQLNKEIEVKVVSFREGVFAEEAFSLGLDIVVVRNKNIFKDIKQTIAIIKKGNYDLIHCHGAKGNIIGFFCKNSTKLPIITTLHSDYRLDYMHSFFKSITIGKLNALVLRKMDAYITVTNNFKKMLISRHFNSNRVYAIWNGLNFNEKIKKYDKATFLNKFNIPYDANTIFVGIVARLNPVKSIDTLIKAAFEIKKSHKNIKFVIAGDGPEEKTLKTLCSNLKLEDTVFFVGWIKDAYEIINAIDISVLTSISESFPYSLLEGALLKKASISTDVGGIPDLFDHTINSFLFTPKDISTLSSYIIELADNKNKRILFGNKLYEKAISNFSLEKMAELQIHAYNDVLSWRHKKKRSYDIILSGYYGFMNIGDDALLYSIINNLKSIEHDLKILILSRNPIETTKIIGVDSISRFNLFNIISTMLRSDLFIYGGGTLIQESTSTRSLLYYLGTMYLAKILGLKTMLYANGVMLLKKKFNILVTRFVMNKIDLITLRESTSLIPIKALNISKPQILITADPAVTTYPCSKKRVLEIFKKESIPLNKKYIGICVRDWKGYENTFSKVIASFLEILYKEHEIIPIFIPMQRKYIDDFQLSKNIAKLLSFKTYILSKYYSAEETMGVIGNMDTLLGMRLHSLIFATCCTVPPIALVYEPKVSSFMDYIELHPLIAGNVSDISITNLLDTFNYVNKNEKDIKKILKTQTNLLRFKGLKNASLAIELKNKKGEKREN